MLHIVLVEPEIPQNTGNIVRTCAATGCRLHLVRPLGFEVSDKYLKRAGLDYWYLMTYEVHESWQAFVEEYPDARLHFATTKAHQVYSDVSYEPDCYLMFGKESAGIPEELLLENQERAIRIPMVGETRSLNLSNSAAIVLYEALRQNGFPGMKLEGSLTKYDWKQMP